MPLLNKIDTVVYDTYHGKEVADPFRWLENRSDPDTEQWLAAQQRRTSTYFRGLPAYDCLRAELSRQLAVDVLDEPVSVAHKLFCRLRRQGHERASIYAKESGMASWQLLVDAADFQPSISINLYRVSSDASALAFLKRVGGSDQASVHCFNVARRTPFETHLDRGYARGLVLRPSCGGFFYCHEVPSSNEHHQIRFSRFSTGGTSDIVFDRPRSKASKLILTGNESCLGALHVYEKEDKRLIDFWVSESGNANTWKILFEGMSSSSLPFVGNKRLFLLSRPDRGGFTVSEYDSRGEKLRRIIEGTTGEVRGIVSTESHLYISLQHGMATEIRYWSLSDDEEGTIAAGADEVVRLLPSPMNGDAVFFTRESYTHPPVVFEHTANANCTRVIDEDRAEAPKNIFVTSYTAKDGTSIPATLIGTREERHQQAVITLVYGAFGSSLLPQFSVLFNLLIEMGALLVVLHVRGGGEKGRAWHEAGRGRSKTVSVSDVIDGVEWLTRQSFVDPERIALYGASAGGLLVASVSVKIPEQLRAVVSIGPLLDMLRYEKFGLARRWKDEFGTSESSKDFESLFSYSPYHNVTATPHRPAFLFVTGDEDDRCDPAHVRKMAARLMETTCGDRPVVLDYSVSRGHTPGLSLSERVTTLTRRCAFLAKELELDEKG